MSKAVDVAIIGGGPAGLFSSLKISESNKNLKILVLDKGNTLEERIKDRDRQKNSVTSEGFGGSGVFSDSKLIFSKITGGRLNEIIGDQKLGKYLEETKNIWLNFIGDIEIDDFTNLSNHKLVKQAKDLGLELIISDILHIGSDLSPKVLEKIYKYLVQNNVEFRMNTEVENLIDMDGYFNIYTNHGLNDIIKAKNVILAPGRGGARWLKKQIDKFGIKSDNGFCDIGLRIEVNSDTTKHLTDELYEFKLKYITPSYQDEVRTFCCNDRGFVVKEIHKDMTLVNGYSNKIDKSVNTNFAFLSSIKLSEPVNNPLEFSENIAKTVNSISGGVMVQRLDDLVNYRRTRTLEGNKVTPTLDCFAGDISLAFPHRFLTNILEGLQAIDKIAPGIYDKDTLLYAPEVKQYSNAIKVDENMMAMERLWVAGDSSGWSRGIIGSCITGLIAADSILSES